MYAGDYIEAVARLVRRSRLRRMVEFEARKVIATRYDLGPTSARVLNEPTVVCRALGTTVIPMSAHERTGDATKVMNTPHRPSHPSESTERDGEPDDY